MNGPTTSGTNRPNEEMIRDRLRNRRSLYELKRASGPTYQRWGRTFFEEPEDVSRAAPVWQRYPIYGFLAGTLSLVILFGAAGIVAANWKSIANGLGIGSYLTAELRNEERDADTSDAIALKIATAHSDLIPEGTGEPLEGAEDLLPALEAVTANASQKPTIASPSASVSETTDAPETSGAEIPPKLLPALKTVEKLPESAKRIAITEVPADPGIDRDVLTGSLASAANEPTVASLLDRARDMEARTGAVWPGFISQFAAGIEAPAGSEAAAVSEDSIDETAIPLPVFKADPDMGVETDTESDAVPVSPIDEEQSGSGLRGVANAYVNMRSAPEMDADILTVLSKGTRLTVLECDDWCKVRFEATEGYVYGTFIDTRQATGATVETGTL
ncbi:SH3 domain-containing protein [Fulvimarina sp. MAC8]|uniref:SH3 domain-containing protein n=1 Tax=Fulvimarina sp. MAC8 TaxID=3162874 RepID=UPI0032F04C14